MNDVNIAAVKRQEHRNGDLPGGNLRSDLDSSVPNALLSLCGDTSAHDRVDDRPKRLVADRPARCQIRVRTSSKVVCVSVKDSVATYDVRGEGREDVKVVVFDERVVGARSRHLELPVPIYERSRSGNAKRKTSPSARIMTHPKPPMSPSLCQTDVVSKSLLSN